jgi:ribulose 1,5-bisphosphate synthetase/thiazole synthase
MFRCDIKIFMNNNIRFCLLIIQSYYNFKVCLITFMTKNIAIIGAGVAGLGAAFRLEQLASNIKINIF